MSSQSSTTTTNVVAPQFLGVLYVATAGQNGTNLGVDEEEIVMLSLALIQRDSKRLLSSTNFIVHPRSTIKSSASDINENSHEGAVLSEECRAELGLTDEVVKERGKPLEDVISEMDSLIKRHVPAPSTEESSLPFAFITESQLPLRQCVHPEASTKDIKLPEYYYEFFDLRKEFCACYDDAHSTTVQSVSEMVKFLELKLPQNNNVDEDDDDGGATTAALTTLQNNNESPSIVRENSSNSSSGNSNSEVTPTEDNPDSQSTQESPEIIVQKKPNYKRFLTEMTAVVMRMLEDATTFQRPERIMGKLEPGICSKNESVDGNTVVRARGLPWQSSDQDIAKFFRGLNIAKGGVALCLSPQGRRNGEALIRFESQEHRDMALKRHKHHIANRYIEVYKASGEDFLSVAGGSNNEAQAFLSKGGQVIVRMRGLPYDCTAKQVVEFFDSGENACKVLDGEEGVLFVKRPDGRATGDAFVQFQAEEDATNALAKHRESIGSRYIELFRSTTAEVQQVLNRCIITAAAAAAAAAAQQSSNSNSEPLMKTLPPLPTDLVTQLPLLPTSQIVPSPVVPPSGANAQQNNSILPQHIITSGTRKDCIRLRGLPYEAQVEHILEFLGEHAKNIVYQGVHMVYNAQGQPSGEAFIQMDSETSAFLAAQSKHHRYMHHFKKQRYIEVFQCSGDDMNLVLTGGVHPKTTLSSVQPGHHHHHHMASPSAAAAAAAMQLHVPAPASHHPQVTLQPQQPQQPQQQQAQQPPLIPTLPLHHILTSQSTSSSTSTTPISSSTNASLLAPPPPPPQTLQYYTHTLSIPRNNAYYHPATTVFYWPYPSPPVSPTYYGNGISHYAINGGASNGHQIGQPLLPAPPPPPPPPHHPHAPHPQESLKHYHEHIRFQEISATQQPLLDPHQTLRTTTQPTNHSHYRSAAAVAAAPPPPQQQPPTIIANGHHHHPHHHHHHPHHHQLHHKSHHHHHHHHASHLNHHGAPTYMMELGLFMA